MTKCTFVMGDVALAMGLEVLDTEAHEFLVSVTSGGLDFEETVVE